MIGHSGLLRVLPSDNGFRGYLGDLPPYMPRWPETWVSLCNLMPKLCGISHSSAILVSDSSQCDNRKSIHPTLET